MAEESTEKVTGSAITTAIAVFMPIIRALVLEAESSGKSGDEKHAAVAEGAENAYRALQSSVKELRMVPWILVAPIILPSANGLISVLVSLLNRLWGKIWSYFKED